MGLIVGKYASVSKPLESSLSFLCLVTVEGACPTQEKGTYGV